MKSPRVTIKDVAAAAGCSPGTVSFVINRNRPISAATRKRVLDAIERLRYQPYGKRGKPFRRRILLLADSMSHATVVTFTREIAKQGFLAETCYVYGGYEEIKEVLSVVGKAADVAGIINTLPQVSSVDLLKMCKGIPAEIYIRNGSMLSSVTVDFKHGVLQALQHLAGLGHRKVAFLYYRGFKDPCMVDRVDCFRNCKSHLERHAVPFDEQNPDGDEEFDALYREGVTAFLASTMEYAVSVLRWSYRRKRMIPDDVSLLVFEDSEIVNRQCVTLTAVQLPLQELAHHTVKNLLAQICDRPPEPCRLSTRLLIGESSGSLKVD